MLALPSLFCPSTVYIQTLRDHSDAVIFIGERYQKQTLRNRCSIMAANGQIDFSIPVMRHGYPPPATEEIQIAEHGGWRQRLEQTLRASYHTAPFWKHYENDLLSLIYNQETRSLTGYNGLWLEFICKVLDLNRPRMVSDLPPEAYFQPEFGLPSFYQTINMPRYWQVFEDRYGFITSLSTIDLILCEGPYGAINGLAHI